MSFKSPEQRKAVFAKLFGGRRVVYHATGSARNVPSIMKKGLLPGYREDDLYFFQREDAALLRAMARGGAVIAAALPRRYVPRRGDAVEDEVTYPRRVDPKYLKVLDLAALKKKYGVKTFLQLDKKMYPPIPKKKKR